MAPSLEDVERLLDKPFLTPADREALEAFQAVHAELESDSAQVIEFPPSPPKKAENPQGELDLRPPEMPEEALEFLAKARRLSLSQPTQWVQAQARQLRIEWVRILGQHPKWEKELWYHAFRREVFDQIFPAIEKGILQ